MSSIAILLASFNGEKYLEEQLESIKRQSFQNWCLYVSDDGSTDKTLEILKQYQALWGSDRLQILQGPQKGFAANFMSLITNPSIQAYYYACCDQDDRWLPEKLATAIEWLSKQPSEKPLVFCGRSRQIDEQGAFIGLSQAPQKNPSFENALVENIVSGNTMVMNNALRQILARAHPEKVVAHDWLAYQCATGCGGHVFFHPEPLIEYRLHQSNTLGRRGFWVQYVQNVCRVLSGQFHDWLNRNILCLMEVENRLTPENRKIFQDFRDLRRAGFFRRLTAFYRLGIYRQKPRGQFGLLVALILKKL